MADFKIIETQEELNEVISKRVNKEKDKAREIEETLTKEIESLRQTLKENEEKLTKFNEIEDSHKEQVAKLMAENEGYKLMALKQQVAHANGLPYELAERLTGTDEETLTKDAENLKQFVGQSQKPLPLATVEKPEVTKTDEQRKQALQDTLKELDKKGY